MPDCDIPTLSDGEVFPIVLGTAALTTMAFGGTTIEELLQVVEGRGGLAQAYDIAIVHQLGFRKSEAMALQAEVLAQCQVFRLATAHRPAIRLLALMAPGDLMVNAPLDFITAHLDVRLDLLYIVPGVALPAVIPDHDVAFFAISEADAPMLERLCRLYRDWPRPVLNDPRHITMFARDALSAALAGIEFVCSPATRRATRADVAGGALAFPALIRPLGSHAGTELAKLERAGDVTAYLQSCDAAFFYVSAFVDYRSPDGMFRKFRVAFIDRVPYLCHMAVSANWMIHYLNAGMTESVAKRADEAGAMAQFDATFARRHAQAFDALNDLCALDYYSIDCAETSDGRLLVFEADTGAIIHTMDPPDLFPYKRPQMQRIFRAFEEMLRRCKGAAP